MNLLAITKIHVLPDGTGVNCEGRLQLRFRCAHGLMLLLLPEVLPAGDP